MVALLRKGDVGKLEEDPPSYSQIFSQAMAAATAEAAADPGSILVDVGIHAQEGERTVLLLPSCSTVLQPGILIGNFQCDIFTTLLFFLSFQQ